MSKLIYYEKINNDEIKGKLRKYYENTYGNIDKPMFIVIKYIQGNNYEEELIENKIHESDLILIMKKLFIGINDIHFAGYCHGDLRTFENIIITKSRKPIIIDIEGGRYSIECAINDYLSILWLLFNSIKYNPEKRDIIYDELREKEEELDIIKHKNEYKNILINLLSYYSNYNKLINIIINLLNISKKDFLIF